MSSKLTRAAAYVRLLLDDKTPKDQVTILLLTPNPAQLAALLEIVHNLLHGQLPLSPAAQQIVEKRRKILNPLTARKLSAKQKKVLVKKHRQAVLQTLKLAKQYVLEALEQ